MTKVIVEVMNKVLQNGFDIYLVGGYVRDYYLNIKTNDYDLATNAKPADLMKIFSNLESTNYGSVILKYKGLRFEITTFRIENKYRQNRFPEYIYTDTIEKDILRRDFTINSMYMDVEENIIDLLNGKKDIDNKIVKMVSNPYKKLEEDSLRILRAIRFATIYNFKLDDELYYAIKELSYLVSSLSYERRKNELDKIFASKNLKYGIKLIKEFNLDKYLEIGNLSNLKYVNNLLGIWAQLDVSDKYIFKKSEKKQIEKIKKYLVVDILNPLYLYNAGLYIAMIVCQIKNIDIKKLNVAYNNLPIKDQKEIDITGDEIIQLLAIKPSNLISKVYQELEINILNNQLKNNKKDIIKYILKKYK